MTANLYQTVLTSGASIHLSSRAKWRLSGADRVRYLNGQVTNDVRTANRTAALYACVTNLKGKIEADIFIHASPDGESLFLDADASLRETLGMRLERYIIADDAILEDITDEWQLWHLIAPVSDAGSPSDAGTPARNPTDETATSHEHRLTNSARFHLPATDLWLPVSDAGTPSDVGTPARNLTEAEAETLRILQKVPAYPHELNADTFPQEAGLETAAMSFTKGCYIGQEILSRIKTTGKMPRQLIAITSPAPLKAGEPLLNAEAKEIGHITSTTQHPETQATIGLAYIKQSAADTSPWTTATGQSVTLRD